MAPSTLGNKFICFTCQCKFYDLNRPEPICPRCGANQKQAPKPGKAAPKSRAAERPKIEPPRERPEEEEDEMTEIVADLPVAGDADLDSELDDAAEEEDDED